MPPQLCRVLLDSISRLLIITSLRKQGSTIHVICLRGKKGRHFFELNQNEKNYNLFILVCDQLRNLVVSLYVDRLKYAKEKVQVMPSFYIDLSMRHLGSLSFFSKTFYVKKKVRRQYLAPNCGDLMSTIMSRFYVEKKCLLHMCQNVQFVKILFFNSVIHYF